jgi:hypothetical protein
VLEVLVGSYRHRHRSTQFASYEPVPPDQVRQLACYSANLVALRVILATEPSGVRLDKLQGGASGSGPAWWQSTVMLWRAGLDASGLQALLCTVEFVKDPFDSVRSSQFDYLARRASEISLARLVNDGATEASLRYGMAITEQLSYYVVGDSWVDAMASWLIPGIAGVSVYPVFPPPPGSVQASEVSIIAGHIFKFLRSRDADHSLDADLIRFLFDLPSVFRVDQLALTIAVLSNPDLLAAVPKLKGTRIYGQYAAIARRARRPKGSHGSKLSKLSDDAVAAVQEVLAVPRARDRYH